MNLTPRWVDVLAAAGIEATHRALNRRSQKDRTIWDRIGRIAEQWLPTPAAHHPSLA